MGCRGKKNTVATRAANIADEGEDGGLSGAFNAGSVPHGWTFEQYMQLITFQDSKRREAEQLARDEEARLAQLAREEARLAREDEARLAQLAREEA